MPDYEAMILERQEAYEACGDCDSDCCQGCVHAGYCPDYSEGDVYGREVIRRND